MAAWNQDELEMQDVSLQGFPITMYHYCEVAVIHGFSLGLKYTYLGLVGQKALAYYWAQIGHTTLATCAAMVP